MVLYPSLAQAVSMANVGLGGQGIGPVIEPDYDRLDPAEIDYVYAADRAAASAGTLRVMVMGGVEVTEEQYAYLVHLGVL